MRKAILFWLLCLIVAMPCQVSASFERTKIAVLDFELQGENFETKDLSSMVAEWFITALVKDGRFDVVERTLLKKIIEEQELSNSDYVNQKTATELGQVLGVKIVISGSVINLGEGSEVNARIIDVQSASVIAAETVTGKRVQDLQGLVVQMVAKIINNFPLEGYIVNRKDEIVTIDLGLLAGVKANMDFVVYKEGKVIKHPKTGEILDVELIKTGKINITSVHKKIATGKITKEEREGAIEYGQLIKSLSSPLKPLPQSKPSPLAEYSRTVKKLKPRKSKSSSSTAPAANEKMPLHLKKYAEMLKSKTVRQKKDAAKKIIRGKIKDPLVLDIVERELLAGYAKEGENRHHADTMSWLCKALGASGNSKYKATLQKVAEDGVSRKLKGYAKKALAAIDKNM
jgi:TolB-like protein